MIGSLAKALRTRPPVREIYYGWWIVAAVTVLLTLGAGITFWTFTAYVAPLEDDLGWSRAQVSTAFSLGVLISGVCGPVVGVWVDRHDTRSSILIGAVLMGVCYILLATVDSLWQFYLFYGLSAFFRTLMFVIPLQSLLARWFNRRRGIAIAIATSGFSLGGVIFLPVVAYLVDNFGWRASHVISGIAIMALYLPLTLLVLRERRGGEEDPDVDEALESSETAVRRRRRAPAVEWSLQQALHSGTFWLLAAGFMLFFMGRVSFTVHAVPYFESRSLSAGEAAAITSYAQLVALGIRPFFAVMADRVGDFRLMTVGVALLQVVAMSIVLAPISPFVLAGFVVLWGTAAGGGPLLEPLLISRTFGVRSFAALLGALLAVETAGDFVGPIVGGLIYDGTGAYTLAFLIYIAGFAVAALAFASVRPAQHPAGDLTPQPVDERQ